jgi:hypothetical protein
MTAQPAVPVRVRCLPSQPPLQSGCCEYSPVSRGRDVSGADSLSAVIKFTRANTTTRSVGRPSSRSAVDTAKQTVFSVAFWRKGDGRARGVTTFQCFVGSVVGAQIRRPAAVGRRF